MLARGRQFKLMEGMRATVKCTDGENVARAAAWCRMAQVQDCVRHGCLQVGRYVGQG